MQYLAKLEKKKWLYVVFFDIALIMAIGTLDYLTGYEFAFSIFYVLPIAIATWVLGKRYGIAFSVASALVWLWADVAGGNVYSHPTIPIWNTIIRLSFFVVIASLLVSLKSSLENEKKMARIDFLTGAANSRFFYDLLEREVLRLQRYGHPFTLVYMDIDNFKMVNDQFGHQAGDQLLREVVNYTRENLRKIDMTARLGGDEFAILLPETDSEAAQVVLAKLRDRLLEHVERNSWPVTFSIGALTCRAAPPGVDELIKMADDLMYSVKQNGKNGIQHFTYDGL